MDYELTGVEIYDIKPTRIIRTGSPIVLVEDVACNKYHSFRRKSIGLLQFNDELKQRALKRYRAFTGEMDFNFEAPLFEELVLRREVPVPIKKGGSEFLIIGSTWDKPVLYPDPY